MMTPVFAVDWIGSTLNGFTCNGGAQSFGPYDYFDVNDEADPLYQEGRWWEAKNLHFAPGRYALSAEPMEQVEYQRATAEFDYLLRVYPNHPDVLRSLIELDLKKMRLNLNRSVPLISRFPPPECYFQRAISFRPKAAYLYSYYGAYLHRLHLYEQALENYQIAVQIDPENAEAHYNMGLCYIELGLLPQANMHAEKAYELGFPLPGLRRKLQRLNN